MEKEAAATYVARFAKDGALNLDDFCKAHTEERPAVLPGFLVAAFPAKAYFGDGDNVTEQEGDGPPSTDDEDEDQVGDMDGVKPSWSKFGGSREASFRVRSPEKTERARVIRSDCLTSHLVTPAFQGRRLVLDAAPPPAAGSQTVVTKPRMLTEIDQSLDSFKRRTGADVGEKEGGGSFKVVHNRKKKLDNLSAMALGGKK